MFRRLQIWVACKLDPPAKPRRGGKNHAASIRECGCDCPYKTVLWAPSRFRPARSQCGGQLWRARSDGAFSLIPDQAGDSHGCACCPPNLARLIALDRPLGVELRLRVSAWVDEYSVKIDGVSARSVVVDGYLAPEASSVNSSIELDFHATP